MKHHDVGIRFASNTVTFDSTFCQQNCTTSGTPVVSTGLPPQSHPKFDIDLIDKKSFSKLIQNGTSLLSICLKDINEALAINKKKRLDLRTVVPSEYDEYLPSFPKKNSTNFHLKECTTTKSS